MLDVRRNRLDYGRLLIPPEGYLLRQAVATTYSVDLDTLLSIPVALYYAQTLEGRLQGKDVEIIRAIQHTARLLTIYHQVGQLKVPRTAKDIYGYFEECLVPILPNDAFTSFHPKTWVLRYEHQEITGDVVYRVIVLSRNLTFDRSWDVAAFLEGKPDAEPLPWNQPLFDFFSWLNRQESFSNSQAFLADLYRVNFGVPDDFNDFAFHPVGIPGHKHNPTATFKARKLLCLSPFLHPQALKMLRENVEYTPYILSRNVELKTLSPELLDDFWCYCLSDVVVDGERLSNADEGDGEPLEQDLHAKVFLFDDDGKTTWFLGSANATKAAFERNIEFLLELEGTAHSTRLNRVRKQLLGNDEAGEVFVPFAPGKGGQEDEADQRRRKALRTLEYALLAAEMNGEVSLSANKVNYDFTLSVDLRNLSKKTSFSISVRPFVRVAEDQPLRFGVMNTLRFVNISETSLNRFLHFTIRDAEGTIREFLIRIEVSGIPETRLDNIFKSIINSRDKLFAYLRFLLTDELSKEDFAEGPTKKGGTGAKGAGWEIEMPIFEQLLVAASRNPRRLLEVDRVISSLREDKDDGVVPDDFLSLWEVFRAAIPQMEGAHE